MPDDHLPVPLAGAMALGFALPGGWCTITACSVCHGPIALPGAQDEPTGAWEHLRIVP